MRQFFSWSVLVAIGICLATCKNKPTEKVDAAHILSPQEAIAAMKIEPGFEIQTVAAEPQLEDPVALQFDETCAMWVVEMRGYMQDKDGRGETKPLGRIKILEDKNDDGRYETATIFLDSLVMPRAVLPVHGGALIIEPPQLFFVENNGAKAGKKYIIDSFFAEGGNVEHQPNGLMPAMDNWIYCAKSNKRVRFHHNKWVVEKTQFRGQWGITQDDWGRLFYNDNSTTLLGDNFAPNAFAENEAYQRLSKNSYSIQLVSNRVFPSRSTAGVNRGYEQGTLDSAKKLVNATAACGPVIYRGDNFPDSYRGNAFVMEPSAYLIKRIMLSHDTAGFVHGKFAYDNAEFVTATDERFRPVSAYNAPDGSLYFIDMHRGIIQHTTYLTPYLRRYIDSLKLDRPIGMGRIYRVKWKAHGLLKKLPLPHFTAPQLVTLLTHKNGWYRDMAQRLLIDRADLSVVAELQKTCFSKNEVTALHALYTMEGLNQLTPIFLQQVAHASSNTVVYTTCMKLLEGFAQDKAALDILKSLAQKPDRLSALQFTNSVRFFENAFPGEVKKQLLLQLKTHRNDTLFTDAFLCGSTGKEQTRLQWLSTTNKDDTTLRKALLNILAKQKAAKESPYARLPKADAELYITGEKTFKTICATCHGVAGNGIENVAPPLAGSPWVMQKDSSVPIRILLDGLHGPVYVAGKQYAPPQYSGTMPGLRNTIETNNGVIAGVLTYVRNTWGNKAPAITVAQVATVREQTANRQQPYTAAELNAAK